MPTTPVSLTQDDVRFMERTCYSIGVTDEDVIHDSIAKLFTHYDPARGAMSTFVAAVAINRTRNLAKRAKYHAPFSEADSLATHEREYAEDILRTRWVTATKAYLAQKARSASKATERAKAGTAAVVFDAMVRLAREDSLDLLASVKREKIIFFQELLAKQGADASAKSIAAAMIYLRKVVRKSLEVAQ